ncbi:hypothetical protein [Aeromonas phage ZPAH34]|uniref:hypothetical protein n=1 Tax=Aeromonas phage ZPAH34 TaxID=2924888 RepID=UPI0023293B20|nr:hypothetical protein PQD16_gp046 [Aeromonas phage ZPAH34]UOX39637.1 hypothetical protein [Aeromonas phage ZPAH34]
MNALNKLYEAMLLSWNVTFTPEYALMLSMGGAEHPVKVDDKNVYLPTAENLSAVTIGKIFFHPACESIMSKETEIFKVIRKLTCAKIYSTWQPIAQVLFAVAGKKTGKTLSDKMVATLAPFKNASQEVKQQLIQLIKGVGITLDSAGIDNRLISFNMHKGGKDENDRHIYWTATPVFPYYNELCKFLLKNQGSQVDRLNFNSSAVSREALELMVHLMEICFPSASDPDTCTAFVVSPDAARLTAYLNSYVMVATGLNSLIGKHRKEFDSAGQYGIDVEWSVELDNLGSLKGLIPSLDYNNQNINTGPEENVNTNVYGNVLNTQSDQQHYQTQQPYQVQSKPTPALPVKPSPRAGEKFIGVTYNETNGIFEYRYQTSNGMERVTNISEGGGLISENIINPMMQQNTLNSLGMNLGMGIIDPRVQAALLLAQGGMGAPGVPPLYGVGAPSGYVVDPYSRQLVPANQNNNNGWGTQNNGWGEVQTNPVDVVGGITNINNF